MPGYPWRPQNSLQAFSFNTYPVRHRCVTAHPTPKAGPKGLNRFDSTLHAYALARLQRIVNICCVQILPKSGSYPLSVLSTDARGPYRV